MASAQAAGNARASSFRPLSVSSRRPLSPPHSVFISKWATGLRHHRSTMTEPNNLTSTAPAPLHSSHKTQNRPRASLHRVSTNSNSNATIHPEAQRPHLASSSNEPSPRGSGASAGLGDFALALLMWLGYQWKQLLLKGSLVAAIFAASFLGGISPLRTAPAHAVTAEIAIGGATSATVPAPNMRQKFLYKLDLMFASNPSYKVLGLAAVCAMVTLIGGIAYAATEEGQTLGESTWIAWSLLIDAGTQKGQDTAAKRRVSVAMTVAGVLVLATLLGIVVEAAGGRLESLRKGRTRVLESGHTLIIGWNAKTVPLARQLLSAYVKAAPNQRHPVVVLGNEEKEIMDEKIRSAFSQKEREKFRIVARSGSPFSHKDLHRCSAQSASSIIVLAPEDASDPQSADHHVIHAALGLSFHPDIKANIVADLSNQDSTLLLKKLYSSLIAKQKSLPAPKPSSSTAPTTAAPAPAPSAAATVSSSPFKKAQETVRRMVPVATGDAALRALVISAVNPRDAEVWMELLTFDGNEYHFAKWPELTGMKFGDAIFKFDAAILCGILRPITEGSGGEVASQLLYCPHPDTVIQNGDQLLFIAEDRYSFKPGPSRKPLTVSTGAADVAKRDSSKADVAVKPKQRVLVSWWRPEAKSMLELLGAFLHQGSSVTILDGTSINAEERHAIREIARKSRLTVEFSDYSSSSAEASVLTDIPLETFDTVVVLRPSQSESLSSSSSSSSPDSLAQESATATAMMIRNIQVGRGRTDSQIVAEVSFEEASEPALEALRKASGVNTAMVPEDIQAQVLAQLSENADVGKLIDSLVGEHLGSLEPRSVLRYANPGEKLSFWDLQARALESHREVIVAWQRGSRSAHWVVNPLDKMEKLRWGGEDQVMVIKAGHVREII